MSKVKIQSFWNALKVWKQRAPQSAPETKVKEGQLKEVCVFPLQNIVLFPGIVLPLHIFEERYKMMTDELEESGHLMAMSLMEDDDIVKNEHKLVCGAGRIGLLDLYPDGRKDIVVEGIERLRIVKEIQKQPYIKALAETLPDVPFSDEQLETKYHRQLQQLARRYIFLSEKMDDQFLDYVGLFQKPHHLADCIGYYFLQTSNDKQSLLETVDRRSRVEKMMAFVESEIQKMENIDLSEEKFHRPPSKELH